MSLQEGLAGLVAQESRPIMVEDAIKHSRFKHFPEAGEDPYHSFLGLPLLDRGLLPWIIASQTIPILAIAPMVVVVLGSLGYPPLVSKAVISMYLCFFPVAIGMVKGLRSPEVLQLDLMRTWSASQTQRLLKLRLPAAVPFLFASAKIAIATSLIGAIVGELPTGAQAGLGARLLSGSYFGQTIQIWSALLMASLLGVALVAAVGGVQRIVGRWMGAAAA